MANNPIFNPKSTCLLFYTTLALVIVPIWTALPPSLRYPIPVALNKITDVRLTCDSENVNVTVTMQSAFKGVIFAKDFAQGCKTFGDLSNSVTITLPTSSCGVRLTSTTNDDGTIRMSYHVVLIAQQDRHLRLVSDQERTLECGVEEEAFLVKSRSMLSTLRKHDRGGRKTNQRVGRMKNSDWARERGAQELEDELQEAMSAARAWMEIVPENDDEIPAGTIQVGETALLTVKSTLPGGIGWKVVDCTAHDGLGDSSQKLLDDYGCPVDDLLMPVPKFGPVRPIAQMRHQEAVAKFAAFKFPDRDRLHFKCGLQLCRGECSRVDCEKPNATNTDENRIARALSENDGEIIDRLEVFNSVEVLAPEIDDLRKGNKGDKMPSSDFSTYPFTNIPGDRTFCVSPDKMAIAFCILGLIFLCAVVVSACSLLRARRSNGGSFPYYTRSLFSSSSGGSAFGSKLLINDSPCMGQPASPATMQYGRIL